jgi:hypothetical protein
MIRLLPFPQDRAFCPDFYIAAIFEDVGRNPAECDNDKGRPSVPLAIGGKFVLNSVMVESTEIDRIRIMPAEQKNLGAREPYALAMLLLLVSSAAAVALYSFDRHVFLYFGDAAPIVKARQFIDRRILASRTLVSAPSAAPPPRSIRGIDGPSTLES